MQICVKAHRPLIFSNLCLCSHGTKCAGVVAAVCNNTKCGCGIAHSATMAGISNKIKINFY